MIFSKKKNGTKKEKRNFFHFNLKKDISEIGYELQLKSVLKSCAIIYGLILLSGLIYRLKWPYIIAILIIGTVLVPYHIYHMYYNLYDGDKWFARFHYMEQMISSFKRQPLLIDALKDTLTIFQNYENEAQKRMRNAISEAIDIIQSGKKGNELSVYLNATKKIEEEFGCHRMNTMHDYMEKVEQRGGEHRRSADILLQDLALWKTNTEKVKNDQKGKRVAVYIVTGACVGVCALTAFLDQLVSGFTNNILYQVYSTFFLVIALIQLFISENKLNQWWSYETSAEDDEKILKNYSTYQNFDMKKYKRNYLIVALLCYGLAVVGFIAHNYIIAIIGVVYGFYIQNMPSSRFKGLEKGIKKVLEYQYPQWIMELTLLLQTESVYVSLQQSAVRSPMIIQEEIKKLTYRLEEDPESVEPYNEFLADLKIDNVSTSMRNLYSINSLGVQEETALIRLIEHNNELLNQAEQIKSQDKLNLWSVYMYVPLFFGSTKIIMDTFLLCASIISIAVQSV